MRSGGGRAAAAAVVVGRARAAVAPQLECRGAALPFSFAGREMPSGAVADGDLVAAVAVPLVVELLGELLVPPSVARSEDLVGRPRLQRGGVSSWLCHAATAAEILLRTWGLTMERI